MNDEKVINNMIAFIENKEKEVQQSKLKSESQTKTDIVKSILDKLESEIGNEN
ncbi:MAG: hypothetical protein HUJ63_05800 [Enterococcus sp.]|nr:hypothetical protein [Enterococcus sp.]